MGVIRLPAPCLVVLIGASGAGKSTWAAQQFRASQVVASDELRAVVGEDRYDQRASKDAFEILDLIVDRRLRRGLLTVIDSTALEAHRRASYAALARRHGVAVHAIVFRVAADVCRSRNKQREQPVPPKVLTTQLAALDAIDDALLTSEGFDAVHKTVGEAGDTVVTVPIALWRSHHLIARQQEDPMPLRFGLQIPNFTWDGGSETMGRDLAAIARAAEDAGFTSIWVMDHFLQIPVAGREWEPMLDSYTALAFIAAHTTKTRLGALVTGVTYRNIAHLGKIIATLDVLSGGRAICGIGAAWFDREHAAYGWDFPPLRDRYQLLEDALEVLPALWGPGSPSFDGRTVKAAELMCYPRPLQDHVPILIGGGGEKRTLRLVARAADACNLFGDADTVRHKLNVLRQHCETEQRDFASITVTHLSSALVGNDHDELAALIEARRPKSMSPEAFAARVAAGTIDDHIGRARDYADAGVHTMIVNLPDVSPEAVSRFGAVVKSFPPTANLW